MLCIRRTFFSAAVVTHPATTRQSVQELEKAREALSAKKAALDKAWGEIKDLKRTVAELKADKDVRKKLKTLHKR